MLNHPNIVTIFDVGSAVIHGEDTPYVVMEFVDGENLRQRMRDGNRLPEEDAVRLMLQICSGVGYAHKRGILHGNITAERVLLTRDGQAKVTGFGAASVTTASVTTASVTTASGDVYALGALLFEMLHGCGPGDVRANAAVNAQLADIIGLALSPDPGQRYRNADHFASVLVDHLMRSKPLPPRAASTSSVAERVQARQNGAQAPAAQAPAAQAPAAQAPAPAPSEPARESADAPTFVAPTVPQRAEEPGGLGCGVILLTIVAVLSVLGLIPLYAWVYVEYTRPPKSGSGVYVAPTASPVQKLVIRTEPALRATRTAAATTALVELPADLTGRLLDDELRRWFAERKLMLAERSVYGLDAQGTILSIEPDAPSVREGSVVTLTTSSGGQVALNMQLGDAVVIESARFTRDEYRPGMSVQFEVTWRALRPVGRDYRVFVHLHDLAGNFIAQTGDRSPANRGEPFPTAAWSADTVVVDTYELPIPLDAQPGLYEIRVGLYDDAGRLSVTGGDAERVKASGVVVNVVRVQ